MVDDEVQSEKGVARCRNGYDSMRMFPASFARVPQRGRGYIYMRFLLIFQAVRMMSKTCNQLAGLATLPLLNTTWGQAHCGFICTMRHLRSLPRSRASSLEASE